MPTSRGRVSASSRSSATCSTTDRQTLAWRVRRGSRQGTREERRNVSVTNSDFQYVFVYRHRRRCFHLPLSFATTPPPHYFFVTQRSSVRFYTVFRFEPTNTFFEFKIKKPINAAARLLSSPCMRYPRSVNQRDPRTRRRYYYYPLTPLSLPLPKYRNEYLRK